MKHVCLNLSSSGEEDEEEGKEDLSFNNKFIKPLSTFNDDDDDDDIDNNNTFNIKRKLNTKTKSKVMFKKPRTVIKPSPVSVSVSASIAATATATATAPAPAPASNSNEISSLSSNDHNDPPLISKYPLVNDKYLEVSNDNIDIIVHRLTPPFLDSSHILSSSQREIINVIKDPTGDLYKYSHNGSHLVNERRLKNQLKNEQKELDSSIDNNNNTNKSLKSVINEPMNLDNNIKSNNLNIRKFLPAYKVKDQVINLIKENQVVIIIGETGSGKTTQIPQFLYEAQYHQRGLIGITQPRRVATISVAKRVSEEMSVHLGKEVGFSIRFNDNTSKDTKIKFMTDGILLREALIENDLDQYSCIVMDEAHERSLNTDILLGVFKELLKRRRDLKLIITSATMNYQKFSKFFSNAPCFFIPGKTFPVEILYQSVPSIDYVDSSVKQALRIHLSKENGDILIFMTGQEDIETTCESINEELLNLQKIDKSINDLQILPIYSSLSNEEQSRVFESTDLRKCIVATNIAETSLTFENVRFVIDSGLMKLKVFNPLLNMDTLKITPISQAQANQRSGRAGRTSDGKAFRLYTLTSMEQEMWSNPIPEIQRSNLMNTILILKNMGVKTISKFPFIDPPSLDSLQTSEYELWSIGALDNYGLLTKLGQQMAQYPLDPPLAKLLILSTLNTFQCSLEIVKIISMISTPSIYEGKIDDKKAQSQRSKFIIEGSDHLTLLNIFNQSELHKRDLEKWCKFNYLNFKSIRQAHEIHSQLLSQITPNVYSCNNNWDIIKECICAAFMQNSAEFYKQNQYQHLRSGLPMYLHPRGVIWGMGDLPKYIIYHELIFTGHKQYLQYTTAVKGQWLIKYGAIFFDIRKRGINNIQHQKQKELEFKNTLL